MTHLESSPHFKIPCGMVIAVRRDRYDSDFKIISGGGRALRPQGGVFCIASSGHGLLDHVCWDTIVYPYDRIGEYTGPDAALCHGIWLVLIKL